MNEEIKKFLEDLLKEYDGALTADAQEKMLEKFGSSLTDELIKKYEDKFGKIEEMITAADEKKKDKEVMGFKGIGDFANAVMHNRVDTNANRLKTLETSVAGEYIIPPDYVNSIMSVALEANPFFRMAQQFRTSGNALNVPYFKDKDHTSGNVFGGIVMYWVEEGEAPTASDLKLGGMNLRLHDLLGIIPVTNDFLEDSPMNVNTLINNRFGQALDFMMEDVFINGSGVGKPLGIVNSPAIVTAAKKTSQSADTIVSENLTQMVSHLPKSSRRNAIFIYGSDTYTPIVNCKLGESDFPAFIPAGMLRNSQPIDTLLGRPAYESEHITAALGDEGDLLLVDPTQYAVLTKSGLTGKFDSSMHLYFDSNRTAFRIVFRIDGQPTWDTYVTPAQGTHYKSPIVKLAARA